MFDYKYSYLLINIFSLAYPLYKSFDPRVNYYQKWKALAVGTLFSGIIFVLWDIYFTHLGVWRFNSEYVLGIFIANLPLEEWMFFSFIPFASMFIYECYLYFVKRDILEKSSTYITYSLIAILLIFGIINIDRIYTSVTFIATSFALLIHILIFKTEYLGRFYISYLFVIIPFLIVNGLLTSLPVVIYNDNENLGIRIFTIPFEDTVYGFLMLLLNLSIYAPLKKRWNLN